MKLQPKISVIVPVFKAEAYLNRCVDSLLVQTFKDFEILLIDDGSPDKSGELCDEYAVKDSRVRVFHKENGGVSSARQFGIDNALGEYTIHADPDDWVEQTMLEELYAKAIEDDADMVICDFYVELKNKRIYKRQQPSKLDNQTVFREFFQQLHCSCWNKLIRRACYQNYNICFPKEMNFREDAFVMFSLLIYPIKISYLPKAFYHYDYFTNTNSIVRKPILKDLNSVNYLISFLENCCDPSLFSEELYTIKCSAKILAFRLGLSRKKIIFLYKEINNRFISDFYKIKNSKGMIYFMVAVIIKNNLFVCFCMKTLYFFFYLLNTTFLFEFPKKCVEFVSNLKFNKFN